MRLTVMSCSSAADPITNFRSVIFLSKITSLGLLQNTVYMLCTAGRCHAKRFGKVQCPVVERLTNSLVTHGRNSVKKLMAGGIIKHSEGMNLPTDKNPIQVIVDAVINSGPREDATRIDSGVVICQAVDNSPLRCVDQAIFLRTTGARESSFRTIKTIAAESEVQCETFISGAEETEIQQVANVFPDQQKLEKRNNFPHKEVLEIIKIIRNNGNDLESRLSMGASRLSVYSITEIFEVLNSQRLSGLRFIEWIWNNNPKLSDNAHICSLIIDNLGRLDDYETMFALLKKFRCKNICLTFEAFGFLPVLVSLNSIKESTQKVVDLLNKIGGSCRRSGICALIEMFSKLDMFEMTRFVINITERKESYYCILVRDKCERGLIEDGHGIIREMRELHLAPSTTVYNYLLGGLYKNGSIDEALAVLGEMNEIGIPPDAITFEVLILFVCRLSKMDAVHQLLVQMVCRGLEPRPSTHAAIVKALFSAEKYAEAHKYVVDSCTAYKKSSNMMYSLIASLYREKGDIMSSLHVLVEMMERCLKPNFTIYIKIVKQLKRIGKRNLARDLENRYSKFVTEFRATHP